MVLFNSYQNKEFSNFYDCDVNCFGYHFTCVEEAYQWLKLPGDIRIAWYPKFSGVGGYKAKQLGKKIPLRDDWEQIKLLAMLVLNDNKYTQNPYLRDLLVETGDDTLYHLSPWDLFWGVDNNLNGKNILGRQLTSLRKKYQRLAAC